MSSMKTHHGRRKRRQAKMAMRGKFKINHKSRAGRTGSVHSKKVKA